jgi:hypothetical protein
MNPTDVILSFGDISCCIHDFSCHLIHNTHFDRHESARVQEMPFDAGGSTYGFGKRRVSRGPNAQVQGRPLGVAEARSGGGVPCNAQLGDAALPNEMFCVDAIWDTVD